MAVIHAFFKISLYPFVWLFVWTVSMPNWAAAGETAGETHVVAIGVCPPWKGMDDAVCSQSVSDVSTALARRFDVSPANIHTLVNSRATVSGVSALLSTIQTTADDRVVLYVNVHNGGAQAGQSATPDNDVMVFWSQDDPRIIEFALAEGKWLLASDFAKMLHMMKMAELIAIFDACESGALATEVIHETAIEGRRVATIASARPGQVANLTSDMTRPLFSNLLARDLTQKAASHDTLHLSKLVRDVAAQAQSKATEVCASRQAQMNKQAGHAVNCNQTPLITDPTGLLRQF